MTRWSRFLAAGPFLVQRLSGWSRVLQAERLVKNPGSVFSIAFWIFVGLVIVAIALELGAWKRTEILRGPFASAGEGSHAYVARVGTDLSFRALFVLKGDRRNNIVRSNLQMWVNGEVWGPPRADFVTISRGDTRAFSHLNDRLFFTLPASVANDASVVITLKYSVRLRERYFTALTLSAIAVFVLWARLAPPPRLGRWLSKSLPIFPTASWLLVFACIAYAAATLYGWAAGYALPTATIFRLFPGAYHLSVLERGMPYAILLFAAAGASCGWLAALKLVQSPQLLRTETGLMRMWRAWSLPVITCLFLFSLSAGGWSGHVRASDINYMSLAGLVPRSDAGAYFSDAFHQAYWGEWDVFGTRRPLAQAFRQFLVLAAQYSYVGTLLIQVGMLAVLTHLVALSITRWRGIWAGIAFVGFMYLLARPFFPTTLTEPPALICTLFSLVFLVEALRLDSLQHAQIALIGMTLALFIRVGSILTVPFMIIWVAIAFCGTNRARFRAFAFACASLVAVIALNAAVGHLYGAANTFTGSNVAWVLCGLSIGLDWSSCLSIYAVEYSRQPNEQARFWFLLFQARDNFLHDPRIFLDRLWLNLQWFFASFSGFLWSGYESTWLPHSHLLVLALVPGLYFVLRHRASSAERMLWMMLALSIVLSAAFFMTDDGWRLLTATHPLVACFAALAFSEPCTATVRDGQTCWRWQSGAGLLAIAAALFLIVPGFSYALARHEIAAHPAVGGLAANEIVVPGGRRITGFLVIPDGIAVPVRTPTLTVSEFIKLIGYARLEDDVGPFVQEAIAKAPFAFIAAGRIDDRDDRNQLGLYIAPPAMLEERDAWAWRCAIRQRATSEAPAYLLEIISAKSLP